MAKKINMVKDSENELQMVDEKLPEVKKAKVNMHLPNGGTLVIGEPVKLNKEDLEHLQNTFGENINFILE